MKAILFSCTVPSLRWEPEERLEWRVHNNKAMVRRQWGPGCPEPPQWPLVDSLNSRELGEFPLHLESSTCADTMSNLGGSSKGDVKNRGCCFTCQYRRASQLIDTQKVQCWHFNVWSAPSPPHPVGIKGNSPPRRNQESLTRNGIKLLSPLHIIEWLFI